MGLNFLAWGRQPKLACSCGAASLVCGMFSVKVSTVSISDVSIPDTRNKVAGEACLWRVKSPFIFSLSHLLQFLFMLIALKNWFSMLRKECFSKVFFSSPKVYLGRVCKLLSEVLYAEIKEGEFYFWRRFIPLTFSYFSFSFFHIYTYKYIYINKYVYLKFKYSSRFNFHRVRILGFVFVCYFETVCDNNCLLWLKGEQICSVRFWTWTSMLSSSSTQPLPRFFIFQLLIKHLLFARCCFSTHLWGCSRKKIGPSTVPLEHSGWGIPQPLRNAEQDYGMESLCLWEALHKVQIVELSLQMMSWSKYGNVWDWRVQEREQMKSKGFAGQKKGQHPWHNESAQSGKWNGRDKQGQTLEEPTLDFYWMENHGGFR